MHPLLLRTMLDFVTNNALVATLVAAAIIALAGRGWKRYRDKRDGEVIYSFLRQSMAGAEFRFRTTHAITSHTHIPGQRVGDLCLSHPKIRRNEEDKESWTIVE